MSTNPSIFPSYTISPNLHLTSGETTQKLSSAYSHPFAETSKTQNLFGRTLISDAPPQSHHRTTTIPGEFNFQYGPRDNSQETGSRALQTADYGLNLTSNLAPVYENRNYGSIQSGKGSYQSRGSAYDNLHSQEDIRVLQHENKLLKNANSQLLTNISALNSDILNLKTQPNVTKISANALEKQKVLKMQSENSRLKEQLETRSTIIEELKLKLNRAQSQNLDTEKLTSLIREEIRLELEEKNMPIVALFKERALKSEQEAQLLKIEVEGKDKEIRILERELCNLKDSEIDKMEELRRNLSDTHWKEYERKLLVKQQEFEQRLENNMNEISILTGSVTEWRSRCSELEERNAELMEELNIINHDDLHKRQIITDYESQKSTVQLQIEKLRQANSDLSQQLAAKVEKIGLLELMNQDLDLTNQTLGDDNITLKGKVNAMAKDLDEKHRSNEIWRQNVQRLENEISKKNVLIFEYEKDKELNNHEIRIVGDRLESQNKENDDMAIHLMRMEDFSKQQEGLNSSAQNENNRLRNQLAYTTQQLELANSAVERWREQFETIMESKDKLDQLNSTNSIELQKTFSQLQLRDGETHQLKDQYLDLERKYNTLADREIILEKELRNKDLELNIYKQQNVISMENNNSSQKSVAKYKSKYQELKNEAAKLLETNDQLRNQASTNEALSQNYKALLEKERQKSESLVIDMGRLNYQNIEYREDNVHANHLNELVVKLNHELTMVSQSQALLQQRVVEQEAIIDRLKVESQAREHLQTKLNVVSSELTGKEETFERMKIDLRQSQAENAALQSKLSELGQKLHGFSTHSIVEGSRATHNSSDEAVMLQQISELRTANQNLSLQNQSLIHENSDLKGQLQKLTNQLHYQAQQLQFLPQQNAETIHNLIEQRNSAEESVKNLQQDNQNLQRMLGDAQAEIQRQLKKSTLDKVSLSPREVLQQSKENQDLKTDIDSLIQKIQVVQEELERTKNLLDRCQDEKYHLEVEKEKIITIYENRLKEASILNEAIKNKNSDIALEMEKIKTTQTLSDSNRDHRIRSEDTLRLKELLDIQKHENTRLQEEADLQRQKAAEWQDKYFKYLKESNIDEGAVKQKLDILGHEMERLSDENKNKNIQITQLKNKLFETLSEKLGQTSEDGQLNFDEDVNIEQRDGCYKLKVKIS